MKTKIDINDSAPDILLKMAEGNAGALTVCLRILDRTAKIDPDNVFGGLGVILELDSLEVYEEKIWLLYKDVCKSNLSKMLAVLRGYQLGYTTKAQIHRAIENYGAGIDVDSICNKVVERLPKFQIET